MIHLKRILTHENLTIRLVVLMVAGILLNMAAWATGYHLLPEQLFRGILPGGNFVPVGGDLLEIMTSILLYNVLIGGGFIALANLFRIRWFPLGYLPVWFHWSMYGFFLGTNSFDVDKGGKIAPSVVHLFGSAGFIEIGAFTIIAAATINLYIYRQETLFQWHSERVRPWKRVQLIGCEYVAITVALVLIVLAAGKESLSILFG